MSDELALLLDERSTIDAAGQRRLLALVADPEQARRAKELLVIDDLLSRAMAPDRSDFDNRVLAAIKMLYSQRHFVQRVQDAAAGQAAVGKRSDERSGGSNHHGPGSGAQRPSARRTVPKGTLVSGIAIGALAALVLIGVLTWPRAMSQQQAADDLARLETPARLLRAGNSSAAAAGDAVLRGDIIRAERAVVIGFADGSRLTLEAGGEMLVPHATAAEQSWWLERGRLRAAIAHREAGSAVEFATAHARVRIVGTRFTLAVADGATRLEVEEGRVAFRDLATGAESIVSGGGPALIAGGRVPRQRPPGSIERECWTNTPGWSIREIPLTKPPDVTITLDRLETPVDNAVDYGARIRGYLVPPTTGTYTFWIAGDDNVEIWMSSNDDPKAKSRIAWIVGGTTYSLPLQWDRIATQRSAPLGLIAGQRYYLEVLHKQGSGGGHVAVGWLKPGEIGAQPSGVVPGSALAPYP
ncbi:MAG: FecR domain-containing protein [Planctomycetes bacterium]|nr:FecR domain-containing protein [Planctomycetota bacterium]